MSNADNSNADNTPAPANKYATVYEQTLCFGGHEEGGWWYTEFVPVLSVSIVGGDEDAAITRAKERGREEGHIFEGDIVCLPDGHKRKARGYTSAAPEVTATVLLEVERNEYANEGERPHYE